MRRFGFAFVAALAVVSIAVAQGPSAPQGPGVPGPGGRCAAGSRVYDPTTVTTVSGTVEAVERVQGRHGWYGIHVKMNTPKGPLDVHLGPEWYLEKQQVKVAKGDAIEVTGSNVQLSGKPALIAQLVKKGDSSLTLRDANGFPVWAGQRRNRS